MALCPQSVFVQSVVYKACMGMPASLMCCARLKSCRDCPWLLRSVHHRAGTEGEWVSGWVSEGWMDISELHGTDRRCNSLLQSSRPATSVTNLQSDLFHHEPAALHQPGPIPESAPLHPGAALQGQPGLPCRSSLDNLLNLNGLCNPSQAPCPPPRSELCVDPTCTALCDATSWQPHNCSLYPGTSALCGQTRTLDPEASRMWYKPGVGSTQAAHPQPGGPCRRAEG